MLEKLKDLPAGIDGLEAVGTVSRDDYTRVIEPLLDDARRQGRRIRFLYQFGPGFEGFTPGAAWEDAKVGLASMRMFDGCAVVGDALWLHESVRVAALLMPCPVRIFGNQELSLAVDWLQSLPQGLVNSHRLLPERGVIVVELAAALRAQDFDALAVTADNWIEAHGQLQGLVIHARDFPGWENAAGLFRHLRFVRDHHRHIARVALAADSRLAELAPRLASHFVAADVRKFGYDELAQAVAWSGDAKANG